ncbi:hypothetical protein FNV43_RR03106 [Rhamnella rubrinervis]|uniref:DNA endonuclease activator Ctp1 C-terminal domain-containing protein n=1 Tax=Rhamnella rubrinervis TaxID=2594499 RepID=A0A8K0HIH2_9ROSA|nr:hypothetical protein FNV43_RR03106 [Rhamnella rubrinervis]
MEGHLENSPKLGYRTENDDVKYVSRLSTILVATIEEAKDRISQIEYIFCSQLFPHFQSKSKILQKIYSEARQAAEVKWKEKENELLLQIEKLNIEKQQTLEENQFLKLEKAKPVEEQEDETDQLLSQLKSQQVKIEELQVKLHHKSKELDDGMEFQNKLLSLVQSKASVIVDKEKEIKEHEKKTTMLLTNLRNLQDEVDGLQEKLREKNEEVAIVEEKKQILLKVEETLFKKIGTQASEIMNCENLLNDQDQEKKMLMAKLERLEENVCELQKELWTKTNELEEGRRLQKQLNDHINLIDFEMSKHKEQLEKCEEEKKLLLVKVRGLEDKVNELKVELRDTANEVIEGKILHEKLLKRNESKTSELLAEKKNLISTVDLCKKLKSQNNYLYRKLRLNGQNMLSESKLEDETDSMKQNQITSPDLEDKNQYTYIAASDPNNVRNEITSNNLEDEKGGILVHASSSRSPNHIFPVAQNGPSTVKPPPVAGKKRPASCWRDTRSHKGQTGTDPHDDFLDTPLELIRGNLNKAMKEEVCDLPVPAPKEKNSDSSDDETQDVNADFRTQKQEMPVKMAEKKGFKFVEPVRKKAERENLKGVECKQCKKFYDVVLCNGEDNMNNGNHNIRCEHHDGVSRHRYRYVPPLTPEGFWNIGFESE